MRNKLSYRLAWTASLILISCPLFAHHAGSNYDRDHPVTVNGTVARFEFSNPHVLIYVEVKDASGAVSYWVAQSGSPRGLFRDGWTKDTLKPGDRITMTGFPSRDGKKFMNIGDPKPPTGKNLTITHPTVKPSP